MNLLLAVAIFTAIAWFPGQAVQLTIGSVEPDSPAASAGLLAGESIVSIDGEYFDRFD